MAIEDEGCVMSVPAWTPAIVRRHPALRVEWLRLVNSLSRWHGEGRKAVLLVLSALAVIVALLISLSGHVVSAIETLAKYWVLLAIIAAIYAATSVSGRRRQLEESRSQSWLIATPIPPQSLLISQAIRVLLPLFVIAVTVVMVPALVALMNEGTAAAAEKVAAAAAGGLIVGGAAGWWMSRRPAEHSGVVPSRYVPQPRRRHSTLARISSELAQAPRNPVQTSPAVGQVPGEFAPASSEPARASGALADASMRPDVTGLSGWPIAQVLAWSRPENSRYVVIAALLAVQGDSAMETALAHAAGSATSATGPSAAVQ